MHGDAWAHVLADDEAAVEIGIVAGGDVQRRQLRIDEAGKECRGGGAGFALPQRQAGFGLLGFGQRAQRFGDGDVRLGDGLQRLLALGGKHGEQRRECRLQARDQVLGGAPIVRPQATDGATAAASAGDRLLGARQSFGDAVDAAPEIHVAKGGDLQRPPRPAHAEGIEAEARQRMLQQRHHGGRREVVGGSGDDEIQERAGRRLGKRAPGRVIDADAPGFEAHGNAAGEQPVRRDERGGAAGRFRRLAQDERDGLGFVLRRRRLDEAHPVERGTHGLGIGRGDVLLPAAGHARWAHGFADEHLARFAGRAETGAAQLLHVGARDAEGSEQLGETELRMLGMLADRRPALRVEMQIEARQHDGALRQPRHGGHQLDRRRHRAGDAGDDHRAGRRRVAESPGLGEDRLIAPRRRRQQFFLGKVRRPEGGDDFEELERALPVLGIFVRHQRGEAVKRYVLGLDHVHQAGEFGGEVRRLRRRVGARRRGVLAEVGGLAGIAADGLRPALHQHGQH